MSSVSCAIGNAARKAGAHIVTSAGVCLHELLLQLSSHTLVLFQVSEMIINDSGAVHGVLLADVTAEVLCSVVWSNATPCKTFMELVSNNVLPDDFIRTLNYSDYSSVTTKINLAVDKLPQFQCCKLSHPDAGPQRIGANHIGSKRYGGHSLGLSRRCQWLTFKETCYRNDNSFCIGQDYLLESLN